MKNYEEIKDIIVNKLKIGNMSDYSEYVKKRFNKDNPIKSTIEEIELLSPDNINNYDFWKLSEELYGFDPVCSSDYGQNNLSIEVANRLNLNLARYTGMLNFVDGWAHYELPFLEIGAGYGNIKSYVLTKTQFKYTGVDCYPRISGISPTLTNGLLPDEIKNNKFAIIYSSNVFQHFSAKQRTAYYDDISKMMLPNSLFVFNMLTHYYNKPEIDPLAAEDGERYLIHYGQMTEISKHYKVISELEKYFNILYESCCFENGLKTFTCKLK